MRQRVAGVARAVAAAAFARRVEAGRELAAAAEDIASTCYDMAVRFHRGGKLIVFGNGAQATDAQHVSVEFMHPVIVGKRALPAMTLTGDAAVITGVARRDGFAEAFAHQLRQLAAPEDIALGVTPDGRCENVRRGLEAAHEVGLLTVALAGGDGGDLAGSDAVDRLLVARSDDPLVVKEVHVTTYHVLWELVHVFLEQPGLLTPGVMR